jgi:hypothetical protein
MNNIANVEYFYTKCNSLLGTNYTSNDWGGEENKKKPINVEWTVLAVNKVYQKIHQPKNGCRLLLSTRFNTGNSKMAVNEEVVNSVVTYLSKLNKKCDNDCACYKDVNCNCVCASHCNCNDNCPKSGGGTTKTANHCNCTGTYQCNCNCACECGNNTECVCDCDPYDCNCTQALNCNVGSARPMTQNCGTACQCNCVCECNCAPPPQNNCGGSACSGVCISACSHCNGTPQGNCGTCGACETGQCSVCIGNAQCDCGACGGNCGACSGCFKKDSLITMSNGSKKRIDEITLGERVKTYIGEDEVILITEFENTIYELVLDDDTKIEVSGGHPFPLKDGGFGSIEPFKQPFINKLLSSKKLSIGDYLYSNNKIISIKNTQVKEKLFNLVLKSELVYYVNGVPVMNNNPFFLVFYCLLSSETDGRFDGKFKAIRESLSDEIKSKLKERVVYIVSKFNLKNYTKEGILNFDISNFSKICLKIMNSQDINEILYLVNDLINYKLSI